MKKILKIYSDLSLFAQMIISILIAEMLHDLILIVLF